MPAVVKVSRLDLPGFASLSPKTINIIPILFTLEATAGALENLAE